MTFTSIVTKREVVGSSKHVHGTYVNDADSTGGEIETQLRTLEGFIITPIGAAVATDVSVVNGVFAVAGCKKIIELTPTAGLVTIVTPANQSGFWMAIGT